MQGRDILNSFNDGIIISNQSLVITSVKRSQMGQYMCICTNSEGEGESNSALLEIQCKWGKNLWQITLRCMYEHTKSYSIREYAKKIVKKYKHAYSFACSYNYTIF